MEKWSDKQYQILVRSLVPNSFGGLLGTLCIAYILKDQKLAFFGGWLIYGILSSLAIGVIPALFIYISKNKQIAYKEQAVKLSRILVYISLGTWSYCNLFFLKKIPMELLALIVMINAGIITGSMVSYTYSRSLTIICVMASSISLAAGSFMLASDFGLFLGISILAFGALMSYQGYIYNNSFYKEFFVAQENQMLLKDNEAKTISLIEAAKMVSIGEMASGIAHEINNPLTVISGLNRIIKKHLLKESINKEKMMELIEKIQKNIAKATGIIQNLKDVSRDGSDCIICPIGSIELVKYLDSFFSEKCRQDKVNLNISSSEGEILFLSNKIEISKVLINIINNGLYEVSNNQKEGDKCIWVDFKNNKTNQLEIHINDSVDPISQEIKSKVMDPFFTTKPPGDGTGLGLSMSRNMVIKNNGTISLGSDKEAKFIIKLPLAA